MSLTIKEFPVDRILSMAHSPIKNYVIPGLTSSLIGGTSESGCVRLFENSRDHQESVTPHSHRFGFSCIVLAGRVVNRLWTEEHNFTGEGLGDKFKASQLSYSNLGDYELSGVGVDSYTYQDSLYEVGDVYSMTADQIHSIHFSRGAKVLFLEGPNNADTTVILEPFVDGDVIPTLKVEDWMFKK